MILHRLDGCAPAPLAYYLKALGVMRVVSEQLDHQARGWWEGERFVLATHADMDQLLAFFLNSYAPSAILSPWNKGSGFFYANDPGLGPIERSTAIRFEPLREGIRSARAQLDAMAEADGKVRAIKEEAKDNSLTRAQRDQLKTSDEYKKRLAESERAFKRMKADVMPDLRRDWRGSQREWMDAALVLDEIGAARFPALLGTGGNDGRLDFTNNYLQRLGELFDLDDPDASAKGNAASGLREALIADVARSSASGLAIGQFAPGGAGGANSSTGPDGESQLNPWNFVLMLEGALMFAAASTKRLQTHGSSRAAAPFSVAGQAAGYASASVSDESARGEQWMPLWSQPMTHAELRRLLAEGRAQLDARSAAEPLDLARAIARLGVARGIHAFQRYGYIERNGQSNLAVPLARFVVPDKSSPALSCLDDLDAWLPKLRRAARDKDAPARLAQAERRLNDALFALIQHPAEPGRWQSVLLRMADIEAIQAHGSGTKAGPIPRLRSQWAQSADDGNPELRLALSLALQCADAKAPHGDGVRRHWLTLEKGRFKGTRTDRVLQGRNGIDDAIALVSRRLIEAGQQGTRRLPLEARIGISASRHDLARLLAGEVDLDRTLALARTLMALDARSCVDQPPRLQRAARFDWPDESWLAIRLALLPWPLPDGRHAGCDPAILRRLQAGDAATAIDIALRRLRAASIPASIRAATCTPEMARRYAAALAFPISRATAAQFANRLAPSLPKENAA